MADKPQTIQALEAAAQEYRARLDASADVLAAYRREVAEIRDAFADPIRTAAAEQSAAKAALLAAIDANRVCFPPKKKSMRMFGVDLGLRQRGGGWQWPPADQLVTLVRQRLAPTRAAALVRTEERVLVSTLTAQDRAQLGIGRDPAVDVPFCAEVATEIEDTLVGLMAEMDAARAPADASAPELEDAHA